MAQHTEPRQTHKQTSLECRLQIGRRGWSRCPSSAAPARSYFRAGGAWSLYMLPGVRRAASVRCGVSVLLPVSRLRDRPGASRVT